MAVPVVGPSYTLDIRKADVQRSVNQYLQPIESGSGTAGFVLRAVPGLATRWDLGAEVRGLITGYDGTAYAVAGSVVYRLNADNTQTRVGTIGSETGRVGMALNLTQLIVVDGPNGYTLDLATQVFSSLSADGFYGSKTVAVLDGYAIFVRPDTGQFYWTAIDNANSLDALDFATAEGAPDNTLAVVSDRRELLLFGSRTLERWFNAGTEGTFARNGAGFLQVGLIGAHTAQRVGNVVMWLGRSENGAGVVWVLDGDQPRRVSTVAVEQAIFSGDLENAEAWTYEQRGHAFYCLRVPGVSTTWCFDVATQQWHERAELVNGNYAQFRGRCACYAYGDNLVGGTDGKVYAMRETVYTFAGDRRVCDRITPHMAGPSLERLLFTRFELDVECGDAPDGVIPVVQMRYSNDGGATWTPWRQREIGRTGQYAKRVRWLANGSAHDRVWQVRFTDGAPWAILRADCYVEPTNA